MAFTLGGLTINNPNALPASAPAPAAAAPAATKAAPAAAPSGGNGVYWVGADGNVYLKGPGGNGASVSNLGLSGNVKQSQLGNAWQIGDPNAPKTPAPAQTGSTTGGSTGTQYADKSGDIGVQQAGLGSVDATSNAGIDAVNKALGTIVGQYEGDLGTAKTEYGSNSNSNESDLQANKQRSLESAVQGRQGLYGTLASLGALNGTGLTLANNAVQKGANEDLTTAADTYATNQRGLDTSYNTYTTNEQRAEQKAKDAGANDVEQVQNDAAKSRQAYLTNLANDYTAEGNTEQAKTYAAQAAALFPQIAATNVPTIDLGYTGSAYTAPTLSQYVGQANNTTVKTTPPTGGGVLNIPGLFALNKKQVA
jgi:hypothetical protein